MDIGEIAKRTGGNFLIFAGCAFVLWLWAALIDRVAQAVNLSTPDHLANVATSIARSSTLEAIVSIWLLSAAIAIAFPIIWRPFSTTTTLMFDVGYGVLGALTGFGLAIGLFTGNWRTFGWALAYSAIIAVGYFLVRRFLPLAEMQTRGRDRWLLAAALFIASPLIFLWG
ncbi:hypothetical protein ATER59S_04742 [Aquamicrobium terrae]|uniref:hypothetical protein n=1 Tax=Mesorhizobium sp. PUT5 TaxID=3454629 RepID=UPI003FA44E8D